MLILNPVHGSNDLDVLVRQHHFKPEVSNVHNSSASGRFGGGSIFPARQAPDVLQGRKMAWCTHFDPNPLQGDKHIIFI